MREEKSLTVMGEELRFLWERKRVKRLNLRVKRDGSVYVSSPFGTPYATVCSFVQTNVDFIRRARAAVFALPPPPPPLGEGSLVHYLGEPYTLRLVRGQRALVFHDGVAELSLPRSALTASITS